MRLIPGVLALCAALIAPALPAQAATASVVPCSGSGPALASAVSATQSAGGGVIELEPNCNYVLGSPTSDFGHGPNGLPVITTTTVINGPATISRAPGAPKFRILEVAGPGGSLTLNGITISNGQAADGNRGFNGSQGFSGSYPGGNGGPGQPGGQGAPGASGGGIYNAGTLMLGPNSVVTNNMAGRGGDGGTGGTGGFGANGSPSYQYGCHYEFFTYVCYTAPSGQPGRGGDGGQGGQSGAAGQGGGVYNLGTLTLAPGASITRNFTSPGGTGGIGGNGGQGGYSYNWYSYSGFAGRGGNGGSGGSGGGIYNAPTGVLTLHSGSAITANGAVTAGLGGPGGNSTTWGPGQPGIAGAPGTGGGIYTTVPFKSLPGVTVSDNAPQDCAPQSCNQPLTP